MEGYRDYVVKLNEVIGKKKFFAQHFAKKFSYWGMPAIFEHMDGPAVIIGIIKEGVHTFHTAPAPEDLLCGVVLYIPEMGEWKVCEAFQTKMLFVVKQCPTTNSTYSGET